MTQIICWAYHEQVPAGHPDDTDIREGFHDVVEGGGGESVDGLAGVRWDALVDQLGDEDKLISKTKIHQMINYSSYYLINNKQLD